MTAPNSATLKIEMMERSLRCFVLGLCSLLPVIGLPMAVMALRQGRRVRQLGTGEWNAARRYARWGVVCACLAFVLLLVEVVAVIAAYTIATTPND